MIQIRDKYRIRKHDEMNIAVDFLNNKKIVENGKIVGETDELVVYKTAYFKGFSGAANFLKDRLIADEIGGTDTDKTLADILNAIVATKNELKEAMNKLAAIN